jgi:hypothetical protein
MAGMGNPKPAATRQRRNRPSTFAVLTTPAPGEVDMPKLPKFPGEEGGWHPLTIRWWVDIWRSPMAPEFHKSDIHGLFSLAYLVNDFWTAPTAKLRRESAAEVRLQSQRYGLSPMDRRRLQWQITENESKERTNRRQAAREVDSQPAEPTKPQSGGDPRGILRSA